MINAVTPRVHSPCKFMQDLDIVKVYRPGPIFSSLAHLHPLLHSQLWKKSRVA